MGREKRGERGRRARRKEGSGLRREGGQTRTPPEGLGRGEESQDGETRACVRWRRRGRGKGCRAVSRAAAAGRSPREREVRAGPGGGSAGQGRRRRTLHSHRELSAAASGRHTPAHRARLSVGAAVYAGFLRCPGPSLCAPLCSKLLWRTERNCGRRALCGRGRRGGGQGGGGVLHACGPRSLDAARSFPLCLGPATPARLAGVLGTAVPGGAQRRVGILIRKPGSVGVLEEPKAAAAQARRGRAGLPRKTSKKSLALPVFQQVPRGVRPQRQREMAPPGAG